MSQFRHKILPVSIMAMVVFSASFLLARTVSESVAEARVSEPASPTLSVMLDEHDLFVDFDVPAVTLLGFDHAPSSRAEEDAMARAHLLLFSGVLVEPSPAARCSLTTSYATFGHGYDDLCSAEPAQAAADPGPLAAVDGIDAQLSDGAARWSWKCDAPEMLENIEFRLFDKFGELGPIEASLDVQDNRHATTLTAERSILDL